MDEISRQVAVQLCWVGAVLGGTFFLIGFVFYFAVLPLGLRLLDWVLGGGHRRVK